MNNRRLSILGLALSLTAGACVADQDPNAPATTLAPAALRERVDRLLPPIVDRSADATAASSLALGAIAHTAGLRIEELTTPFHPIALGSNAGARAAAWLDRAVLSDDAFDGLAYHLDPGAVCGDDDACVELLASADLSVVATPLGDDGVQLAIMRGFEEAPIATIALASDGAHLELDTAALAALAPAFHLFPWDLGHDGRGLSAIGAVGADLSISGDVAVHFHTIGPVHVAIGTRQAPAAADATSLDVGDGSSIDVHLRGHGPVVVDTKLVSFQIHTPGGGGRHGLQIDDAALAALAIDAQVVVHASEVAITHLRVAAP